MAWLVVCAVSDIELSEEADAEDRRLDAVLLSALLNVEVAWSLLASLVTCVVDIDGLWKEVKVDSRRLVTVLLTVELAWSLLVWPIVDCTVDSNELWKDVEVESRLETVLL